MSSETLSLKLQTIAAQARDRSRVFTTLAHLIDEELLREAYRHVRKDAAPGVDGQTGAQYAENLDDRLRDLHERLRSRRYRAQPVRRVRIRKAGGGERPIGIPSFEDKIVQRAVVLLLTAVYEEDFYDFSYGFRPGRGAHDALHALWQGCMGMGGGWVIDADIRGFFDAVDRAELRAILRRRINDGGILRLIGKWLKAGALDAGELVNPETGTPQGGVISPLLANVYLHVVLDAWFAEVVQPRLRGPSLLIRYADDFLIVCRREDDARRVLRVLPKRLGKYGLDLHPDKTRLVRFRRARRTSPTNGGAETLTFLGFTHHWGRSRRGSWVVKRRTASRRLRATQTSIARWCRTYRHLPVADQHRILSWKLRGHFQYFGITGNLRALRVVSRHTERVWRKWLNRRGGKPALNWSQYQRFKRAYPLPRPRIVHRWTAPCEPGSNSYAPGVG